MPANFNRIARAYRWLEYASFGPMLKRCRFYWMDGTFLNDRQNALVVGDGDGRFTARLLRCNTLLNVEAVDASSAMLSLLQKRVAAAGNRSRLTTWCEDARLFIPKGEYDLVATHFFLDCLATDEIAALAARIRPHLSSNAVWIVSDFGIPSGIAALPGRAIVSLLYAAFGVLTGLEVRRLPGHSGALAGAGFSRTKRKEWLGGLLFSELWELKTTDGAPTVSH